MDTKKVAILVDDLFEQAEFVEPKKALEQAGYQVVVVSPAGNEVQGLNHIDKADTFKVDQSLDEANPDDFRALVLPGGALNADHLRMNETARQWVRKFFDSGKLVGVICHAPWLLASAGVIKDRQLTSYYTIQDDLRNAGATWVDQAVVIDDNLITSRQPDDMPAFGAAFVKALEEK